MRTALKSGTRREGVRAPQLMVTLRGEGGRSRGTTREVWECEARSRDRNLLLPAGKTTPAAGERPVAEGTGRLVCPRSVSLLALSHCGPSPA